MTEPQPSACSKLTPDRRLSLWRALGLFVLMLGSAGLVAAQDDPFAPPDPFAAPPDPFAAPSPFQAQPSPFDDAFSDDTSVPIPGLMTPTPLPAMTPAARTTPVTYDDDPERFERERRAEALLEELRSLHIQQRYDEAIAVARELLALDPENSGAKVWMARAQQRLDALQTQQPIAEPRVTRPATGTQVPAPVATPVEVAAVEVPLPDYNPAPLAPRTTQTGFAGLSGGVPPMLIAIVAGVAVLLIAIAFVVWLRIRASQRQLESLVTAGGGAGGTAEVNVDPIMYDAVTQQDAVAGNTGLFDAPTVADDLAKDDDSVMQFGEVGVNREGTDAPQHNATPLPLKQVTPPSSASHKLVEPASEPPPPPPPREESVISIDMSDPQTTGEGALNEAFDSMFGSDAQPEPPKPAPPPAPPSGESYSSLMFGDTEETRMPGAKAEKDDDVLSFDTLMFPAQDETSLPGKGPASGKPKPDMPTDFDTLMFGNTDETLMPPSAAEGTGNEITRNLSEDEIKRRAAKQQGSDHLPDISPEV